MAIVYLKSFQYAPTGAYVILRQTFDGDVPLSYVIEHQHGGVTAPVPHEEMQTVTEYVWSECTPKSYAEATSKFKEVVLMYL